MPIWSTRNGSGFWKIYIDADACPVTKIVERVAQKHNISCTLLCDTNHVIHSDYSEVVVVGSGADAVDFKLVSLIKKGDICVTQDHGIRTIAFPSISTGAHHYPLEAAAEIAAKTVKDFNKEHMDEMDFVRFVLFDEKTREVYEDAILDAFHM